MLKDPIFLSINYKPVAQQRPRFGKHGAYNPQSEEKRAVAMLIKTQLRAQQVFEPLQGPIKVECTFYHKNNKNKDLYHQIRPDIDNYIKFYFDCMNGIVYKDDAQIAFLLAKKIYGDKPKVEIIISQMTENE